MDPPNHPQKPFPWYLFPGFILLDGGFGGENHRGRRDFPSRFLLLLRSALHGATQAKASVGSVDRRHWYSYIGFGLI
jgi:hypothetical protein